MTLTDRDREVSHYVTLGLVIGLDWLEARRIAREIVDEKRGDLMTLTEFLLARIAEDEERAMVAFIGGLGWLVAQWVVIVLGAWVLITAQRRTLCRWRMTCV